MSGQMSLALAPESTDAITLRPYQEKSVCDLREGYRRIRSQVLNAPTGSGKTVVACEILKLCVAKGKKSLFLAHRRELINQSSDKLTRFGVPHGIIMAGNRYDLDAPVQVASIQTLWHRSMIRDKLPLPECDLIILDECHRSLAPTYLKLIEAYPNAFVLGLTATPCRGDGKGLGHIYQGMVQTASIRELTEMGFLVPTEYFAPSAPDLRGVKVRMGDYVEGELESRMDTNVLVGNIVENWGRLAEGRQTVVFASGVKHSIHIAQEFQKAGVSAEHLDGNTPMDERDEILRRLASGDVTVVSNCMVLTEGWDCPIVSCCVIARPTKSLGLYLQMAGRALRPWEGKENCLIVDHAGVIAEHWPYSLLDVEPPWCLDESGRLYDSPKVKADRKREAKPVTCPECKSIFKSRASCPNCGWQPKFKGEAYEYVDGDLVKVTREKAAPEKKHKHSEEMRLHWYQQLKAVMLERGYREGWLSHTYKKKFGEFPPWGWKNAQPIQPGPEVLGYVRSRLIAFAKKKGK